MSNLISKTTLFLIYYKTVSVRKLWKRLKFYYFGFNPNKYTPKLKQNIDFKKFFRLKIKLCDSETNIIILKARKLLSPVFTRKNALLFA